MNVNDQRSLQIQLRVGQLTDVVNVSAEGSAVETSPAVGTVVNRHFVENLPLNGRSFQSLITLTPGVVTTRAGSANAGQFSVNGQRANANYFTVDGVSANIGVAQFDVIGQQAAGSLPGLTSTGGTNNLVSVDALEEFRIETSSYAPEFGRTPGGQVSLVTRGGTSDYRGAVFEYFRNDVLDANDWFANSAGLGKAALRQNLFGGTLSGPVTWPRFGEGGPRLGRAARTFFFFSYEGLRLRQPQTTITTVPSLRLRAAAAPALRPFVAAFPLPTGPEIGSTGRSPFAGTFSNPSNTDATSLRVDHAASERLTLFGRFNYAPSRTVARSVRNPVIQRTAAFDTSTLTFGTTFVLTPSVTNDLRANYSRTQGLNATVIDAFGGATPFPSSLVLPAGAGSRVSLNVGVLTSELDTGVANNNQQRQFNLVDSLSVVRGAHQLKFGADYRRLSPVFAAREYSQFAFFLDEASVISGNASFAGVFGVQRTNPIFHNFSLYAQDTWKAMRRLTLTYGLRWEVNPPPSEAGGRHPFVVRGFDDPAAADLAPSGTPLWETTYDNFAPRVGAAYMLSERPGRETVVRGGFGLFYDLGNGAGADAFARAPFLTPFKLLFGAPYPLTPAQAALPPFPTDASHSQIIAFDPELRLPYTWQWNLTAEQSLGQHQTVSAGYVAAVGRRLIRKRQIFNPNPRLNVVDFIDNGATSDYHALQLQYQRRLSRGLQALASYTWSHAIDEISDEFNSLVQLRGDADFDVRHNFSAAVTYQLPGPKPSGVASALFRDWAVDAIVHAQTAVPLTVLANSFALLNTRGVSVRPDRVEGVPVYLKDPQSPGGRRLNPGAFSAPAAGTQGNLGRNSVRGFPLQQIDLTVRRQFGLTERAFLQFRAEAFNVFNHPNFADPVNDMTNPLFGLSTAMLGRSLGGLSPIHQLGGPRSIQFAVKLGF
jgi:hypothetical protein